jgi:hypothetical protein
MEYVSQGILNLKSSASYCFSIKRFFKYSINDFVFIKEKAKIGVLDRVCIKKYFTNLELNKYKDTFNRIWFEEELIPHQEAINLSIAFYERKIFEIN